MSRISFVGVFFSLAGGFFGCAGLLLFFCCSSAALLLLFCGNAFNLWEAGVMPFRGSVSVF